MKNRISHNVAAYTHNLYSPDGLVAWWDFSNESQSEDKTIDIVSALKLDGNAVIAESNAQFDGYSALSCMTPIEKDSDAASIEISFRARTSPRQWWTVISNHHHNDTFPSYQVNVEDNLRLHTIVNNIPQTINTGVLTTEMKCGTFSFTWNKNTVDAYWNGTYCGSITDTLANLKAAFYGYDGKFVVGQRDTYDNPQYSIDSFCGDVFSVRFYNRQLTQDEVAHNHEIDKKRFQLA